MRRQAKSQLFMELHVLLPEVVCTSVRFDGQGGRSDSATGEQILVKKIVGGRRVRLPRRAKLDLRCSQSTALAVLPQAQRRHSEQTADMVGEMTLVGKTGLNRDLANGQMAFSKKRLRMLHPALDHVLMHRHSDGFAERGVAVGNTHTGYPGDLLEREFTAKIVFVEQQPLSYIETILGRELSLK